MKKEIGGYLELEDFGGKEYYPNLYKVNLGRTALKWLIESRGIRKLILPYFLCDSVTEVCEGMELEFYHLDQDLTPCYPRRPLESQEYLYLVNYYGQLTDKKILEYQEIYKNIIVDHTHAFYQRPLKGIDTLYSVRKFWGVSDGAYLSTDAELTGQKPQDVSAERMTHILGRYEKDAGTYYQTMLDNAAGYHGMEILRMSRLTENLLGAIDYEGCRQKREDNYAVLKQLLPSENPFTRVVPRGPFCYPYYHKKGQELRKRLAEQKIFVPVYWGNVLKEQDPDSLEYQWAADILPLPCDHRYGQEEMEYIAATIKKWEDQK
ncbi:hypothetical protein [Blautia sp.]|uniref:DegT/DnrJ/EryC1/StrS aminotransferase family protein n=1 Tax=Blautia glucerasea TaxID=536633 RepID=A0A6N2UFA3_9FIRM